MITDQGSAEFHLIRAAVAGNRSAFEVLIQQYRDRLTGSLKVTLKPGSMIEDIVAQTFALAFERLSQFRGEASFYTWVYRIALHTAAQVAESESAVSLEMLTQSDDGLQGADIAASDMPEKKLEERMAGDEAHKALEKVPERYRRILELYFLDDLSYENIADELRIPVGTVMSRLFKARKLLQSAWSRMAGKQLPL